LKSARPDFNIEILGINAISDEVYNPLIIGSSTLPWLQDSMAENVWETWGVEWRDVRILDAENRLFATMNLTSHDLALEENRAALKSLFLQAAKAADVDGDHLPDTWEKRYFSNTDPQPQDDPDHDGRDNFTEFAFGTDPTKPDLESLIRTGFSSARLPVTYTAEFFRPAGSIIDFSVDYAKSLSNWVAGSPEIKASSSQILFDGTGRMKIIYSLKPSEPIDQGFLRIQAKPRSVTTSP